MRKLIKNGYVLDDQTGEKIRRDLLIVGEHVVSIKRQIEDEQAEVFDVQGGLVVPGFIDMHVHLREPGFEEKETIETGSKAAARGGFTTIACMPNTRPIADHPEVIQHIRKEAKRVGLARVLPIGAITKQELGEELTDMEALQEAGIVAVSDDGVGVQNARIMKAAMKKAAKLGLPVVAHCEDNSLAQGGVVHQGSFAAKYALPGIPSEAEAVHVARDILLAEDTGVHYHVCHISSEQSVRHVREAKARGQKVTAEVTPHHLLLCDEDIPEADANWKMNPPLRSRKDQEALLAGLIDGTIDFIATDHAPHTEEEKAQGIQRAPFGIVGLETAFPLLYTYLVLTGKLTLKTLVDNMTRKPAACFGLPYGRLQEGAVADITVIDLETEKEIDPKTFFSKGKNTPFAGWKAKGWPILTMLAGKITWRAR